MKSNNNRRFEAPELEIVEFTNDDIILTSSFGDPDPGEGDVFPKSWW